MVLCENTINCVKSGGSTEAPPVKQAVCGKMPKYGISRAGNASELWVGCGHGVKLGSDLQQTVCEQTAGYEIHRNQPISIRHRSGSRWRGIVQNFLYGAQDLLQKASSFERV